MMMRTAHGTAVWGVLRAESPGSRREIAALAVSRNTVNRVGKQHNLCIINFFLAMLTKKKDHWHSEKGVYFVWNINMVS